MPSNMIDSILFRDVFSDAEMREIFSDERIVQNWLDTEAALAEIQGKYGIIPIEAAEEIKKKANVKLIDLSEVHKGIVKTGHSLVPTLQYLEKICDNSYGEYIHLGPTTQDIIDTGFMLSIKDAYYLTIERLEIVEKILKGIALEHKSTVMAGRTHGQQALPITFGFKAAVWLVEIRRSIERLKEGQDRVLVGQMNGAVGTLASFGLDAIKITNETIERLGLKTTEISWASSRDIIAELVTTMAISAGTLGRISHEITTLGKTEFFELEEGFKKGTIGSSTMPHKRNPNFSEAITTLSKISKANMMLAMESMGIEHERDGALWKVEWYSVSQCLISTGAAAKKMIHLLENLVVHKDKMLDNLNILKGLMLSEPVMLEIGKKIGKQTAHHLVYKIAMETFESNASFKDMLLKDELISENFSNEELDNILDPSKYTGFSKELVENICK